MTKGKRIQGRVAEYVQRIEHIERAYLCLMGSGLFIDGVMGRAHGSRRDPRKDKYGKISRRCRRNNWEDCHLERFWRILVEIDRAKYSTSPTSEEETALWLWASSYEYSDGSSDELSGDDLAKFHGLVLPRSRWFGDNTWHYKYGDGTSLD
ncbi:hypothetical protein Acr_08g0007540 [Actinidia rufa]|uniref:Uncharacterized protein n=1 Tax=Actinidia rufa TaxID=165716 RepID=A0A7J0F0Y3_9ERIC|nr:hypothetical protein Acr_08g0007540 [Actinidia rufa]